MSLLKHSLSQKGRAAIDNLLRETVESKRVPATFFGVTTADSELYYDQKGDRIFGKPDQGEVDEHTSKWTGRAHGGTTSRFSPEAVFLHQALHRCECDMKAT
jgi:hypothetical protein